MDYLTVSPADRLTAAHEYFDSSGMTFGKIFVLLIIAGFIAFLIFYAKWDKARKEEAMRENDRVDENDE